MKTALTKISFTVFSILIVLLAWWQARGENWLVCALACLAAASAIWGLAGIYNPSRLFFAHPTNQTREHAFFFPFKLGLIFAFSGGVESCAAPEHLGLCFLIIGGFLLGFVVSNANNLRNIPHYC
ncbi:MAG: hypothetical protein FWD79_10580 [Desulfobulbus sp.]|nr:hypothetical protein [Desulfobulbus sp.]